MFLCCRVEIQYFALPVYVALSLGVASIDRSKYLEKLTFCGGESIPCLAFFQVIFEMGVGVTTELFYRIRYAVKSTTTTTITPVESKQKKHSSDSI